MKRVLIWDNFELKNTGGPSGYLYNLHKYLEDNPESSICFLSDVAKQECIEVESAPFRIFDEGGSICDKVMRVLKKGYYYAVGEWTEKMKHYDFDINRFDFVHIHRVPDVVPFLKAYPEYVGKVILTSHCPSAYVDERIISPWIRCLRPIALHNECKNYKSADVLLFPCYDAREPYEKNKQIKRVFRKQEDKFEYAPSAIMDYVPRVNAEELYKNIGVPDNSFIVTFFGRHNEVKGYDILKSVGMRLMDKYPNLVFVCGGIGPVSAPKHPRWIELGFVSNVADYLSGSDLYIVPNRDTYFDLSVLEILRSGTRVLLSNNGGNKYFKSVPSELSSGIDFFEIDDDSLFRKVSSLIEEKMEDSVSYSNRGHSNRVLFLEKFTMNNFVESYKTAIGI